MSASTEKKNRKAARDAGTDKKALALEKEKQEQARSRRNWTIGTILVVLLLAVTFFLNSGFLFKHTTAYTINGESVSPAEVSYYYGAQESMYSQYASYYGMDISSFISEDDMLEAALEELEQIKAFCAYADENGITLDEDEIAEVTDELDYMELQVVSGGYKNLDTYLSYNYGTGVNRALAEKIQLEQALAEKAYNAKSDSLEYSDEELEEYYVSLEGEGDCFDYDYYYISADTVESEPDEDGNTTSSVTEETMAEAKATADAIVDAYEASEEESAKDAFAMAVDAAAAGSVSGSNNIAGDSLNSAFKDWLMDSSRSEGDIYVCENSSATGYYVLVFLSRNDNHYNTVAMRHVLIKAEENEDGEYTEDALAAAREEAEALYEEWKSGEMTEDSFAELANSSSEDSGSNTTGGLYEDIYKGQMVTEINDYIFSSSRKAGDTEIIDVVSSSYAGTHIVYFVGEGDLYSNVIARDDLVDEAMETWQSETLEGYEAVAGWTKGLVGK